MLEDGKLSAVLTEFARTMITDFPIQSILDGLVENIVEILPISSAGVTLVSPGNRPRYIAASDDSALAYEKLQEALGEGPCTAAYESGSAVAIPDLRADDRFPRFAASAIAAGCAAVFTFPLRHGDGRLGALDLYRDEPGDLDPSERAAAQTLADVTAAYLLNAAAREEARVKSDRFRLNSLHDALTNLPNRALLLQRLEHASNRARRSHTHSAVLYADLDNFKQVNDAHGHGVGDELLIAVSQRHAALVRPGDTLARVSGDEFVFLCEDIRSNDYIDGLATRISAAFDAPFHTSRGPLKTTASVGIAFAGPGVEISQELVAEADIAMYRAKRKGASDHRIVDLRSAQVRADDDQLERAFREAFSHERLDVAYQPIVRASDGSITGVEALLRWTDPERGPIATMSMVEIAERNGLINDVGGWVLERACRDHLGWLQRHPGIALDLAVNISALQLLTPGFTATIGRILEQTGVDPATLILEMTETIFIADGDRALTVLSDLKAMHVQLALDDFGTGYSSLSYLRTFPVDMIKIDQSFTADLGEEPGSSGMVASLIQLAHVIGLKVTVEGVETQAQCDRVRAMGPDAAQGYYFSRPAPAEAIAALLEQPSLPAPAGP